jgi:hypothetical protein
MPELTEPSEAWLEVETHPDAEIFLIGNDRQVIRRAVGKLRTRQPKGLYRLKVTRAAAATEQLVELDRDLRKDIVVEGLDTLVPFARTTTQVDRKKIEELALGLESSNVLLIGRTPLAVKDTSGRTRVAQPQSPLASVRLMPWNSAADNMLETNERPRQIIGSEYWSAAGKSLAPGVHVLEIDDGFRATRQAVPVLPRWQTRVYVRRQPPNAAIAPEDSRPQDTIDVAVHFSSSGRPIALEEEFESSEVVRWALAMGRSIVHSREAIDVFVSDKFDDPLAGIAAAHLMFDAVERTKSRTESIAINLTIKDEDLAYVIDNLTSLLAMPHEVLPDFVALKLRAGMSLTDAERTVSRPPVYARSWDSLLAASVGGSPRVHLDPDVFKRCAANYAEGAYFGWAPTSIANYVEHVIASNREALESIAAKATDAFAAGVAAADSALVAWPNAIRATRSVRRKAASPAANVLSTLMHQESRAKLADWLNVPRTMLDVLLPPPPRPLPASAAAAVVAAPQTPQPAVPPSSRPISQRAFDMIVEFEVGGRPTYEQTYRKPTWRPATASVTIGIGYNIGYVSKSEFHSDWTGRIPDAMIAALDEAVGVHGQPAESIAEQLRAFVDVPWDTAIAVHRELVIPRWVTVVQHALPNTAILGSDALGVLVSLTYSFGAFYDKPGDRYREMRSIKRHIAARAFSGIPREIRSMKRLSPAPRQHERREREAAYSR